tara:strand:+ start:387 stop:785 length:399 start_codon:yes stop_codon:yes gene_type:complete
MEIRLGVVEFGLHDLGPHVLGTHFDEESIDAHAAKVSRLVRRATRYKTADEAVDGVAGFRIERYHLTDDGGLHDTLHLQAPKNRQGFAVAASSIVDATESACTAGSCGLVKIKIQQGFAVAASLIVDATESA